jgi:sugar phosphate isomerase/epimerase
MSGLGSAARPSRAADWQLISHVVGASNRKGKPIVMKHPPITRRAALKTGLAAAWPLAGASRAAAAPVPGVPHKPAIGIATFGFPKLSNAELARELAAAGIRTVQLFLSQTDSNFWRYNQRSDVSSLTADRCRQIADTYRQAGLNLHSLGVYTNLLHPDPAERKANLAYFEAMMVIGGHMGVRTFVTEAGHYSPGKPEAVEHHFQEPVWKQMVDTGRQLAALAKRHDAVVLLEPFFRGFLASAKRTRLFLEEVGSRHIRALLDPANLLEVNDLNEMFGQLGPHIDCLHAKDRKLHVDQGVPAGQGDLDYLEFVKLAARHTPHAPLILEYVGPANFRQALDHLREAVRLATERVPQ